MNCKTKNKIYHLSYTGCQVQNVGQTVQYYNKHMTNHRSFINNEHDRNNLRSKHFNSDFGCNPEQLSYKRIKRIIANVHLRYIRKIHVSVRTEKPLR